MLFLLSHIHNLFSLLIFLSEVNVCFGSQNFPIYLFILNLGFLTFTHDLFLLNIWTALFKW